MPSTKSSITPKADITAEPRHTWQFEAIGTAWSIDIYQTLSSSEFSKLKVLVADRIADFDRNYSRFRPDSLVSLMAENTGDFLLPDDAKPMLDFYKTIYEITDGLVTPLVGNLLSDAGYDSDYSLKPSKLTAPPKWDDALSYNFPELTIKQPTLLDFGAAGKGYLVDIIGKFLNDQGIIAFCIDASGDILFKHPNQSLKVGLEHPAEPGQVVGVADIRNMSLCGSAPNRRRWGDFSHIIDPKKLKSPNHLLAVWVVAETAMLADGLATCLFFTDSAKLAKRFEFSYALINEDYSLIHSPDFPAEFFTELTQESK